ncbi:PSPA7_2676 family Cys-rich small protein [Pseudomonas sp. QL9]|uniref:PSPA7_2676 family Cys-rich small protein n=1 Tax=Pseudomonas sp. QL9 TaxID=3242725 RepID=UPI00352A878D
MRLRCFFLGCQWSEGVLAHVGGMPMIYQRCSHCGAQRYLSVEEPEAEVSDPGS